MPNTLQPQRFTEKARPSRPMSGPLRTAKEGYPDTSGEWLLREFARANQAFAAAPSFDDERPWWRFW